MKALIESCCHRRRGGGFYCQRRRLTRRRKSETEKNEGVSFAIWIEHNKNSKSFLGQKSEEKLWTKTKIFFCFL